MFKYTFNVIWAKGSHVANGIDITGLVPGVPVGRTAQITIYDETGGRRGRAPATSALWLGEDDNAMHIGNLQNSWNASKAVHVRRGHPAYRVLRNLWSDWSGDYPLSAKITLL